MIPRPFTLAVLAFGSAIGFPAGLLAQKDPKAARPADGFALPDGAVHRFGSRQLRHPEGILSAVVSPDGNLLATVGPANIIVWDLSTLAAKRVIATRYTPDFDTETGDANPCLVAFTADSRGLITLGGPASGGVPRKSHIVATAWDIATGQRKFGMEGSRDLAMAVWTTAGGKEIAVASGVIGTIWFFDAANGKELKKTTLPVPTDSRVYAVPAADLVAVLSIRGPQLIVYDARTGKERYAVPFRTVRQVAFSADGKMLAISDDDGKVRVHDVEAKKELFSFDHPEGRRTRPMRFSADRKVLYLSTENGEIDRWDLLANRRLPRLGQPAPGGLHHFTLSPDESMLYAVGGDGLVHRWDLKAGKPIRDPDGYVGQTAVALHPDGKHLFVADRAGRIDQWDIATGRHVKQLQESATGVTNCLTVSADGRWLACGRAGAEIQLWDLASGKLAGTIRTAGGQDNLLVERLSFGPDGRVLFSGVGDSSVSALEVPSGKRLWNVPQVGYNCNADPRGRWVTTGILLGSPGKVALLDAATGRLARAMVIEPSLAANGQVQDASWTLDRVFTPDGSRLITCHGDGTTRVWDPDSGNELARMTWNRNENLDAGGLACSPDGKWVANREGRKIVVWEWASGARVLAIAGHDSPPREIAFTRSGREIIGNADLSPVLWSLRPKDLPALGGSKDALWETLASTDGPRFYPLLWALVQDPKFAVEFLAERAKRADESIDRTMFDKLVANLDSPQFRVRESAERDLFKAGHRVPVAWLRKATAGAGSDEQRARLARVLSRRAKPVPEEWRLSRAVQVLELAGTAGARDLLKTWAAGPDGSVLAGESKSALGRLAKP